LIIVFSLILPCLYKLMGGNAEHSHILLWRFLNSERYTT
jgi:hypothetical protein